MIDDVCTVLSLSVGRAIKLLRHYKWNEEALMQDYATDPVKVRLRGGLRFDFFLLLLFFARLPVSDLFL